MAGPNMAPFPYTGGKARIAAKVWRELGPDCYSYLEPFLGSGAVLLARPTPRPGESRREIAGDLNGYIANAYRSIQWAADETARYAWWPSIHADLTARHRALVEWGRNGGLARLTADPEYYDPKMADWWLWGISNWISIGDFCQAAFVDSAAPEDVWDIVPASYSARGANGRGTQAFRAIDPATEGNLQVCFQNGGGGCANQKVNIPDRLPQAYSAPQDIPRIPHEAMGMGLQSSRLTQPVHASKIPSVNVGHTGRKIQQQRQDGSVDNPDRWIPWFRQLAARLARVYILARPWDKVLGSRTLLGDFDGRTVGIFLDPPYRSANRSGSLYALDDGDAVFPSVWQWAKEHGQRQNFRIAICGLAGDFDDIPPGWTEYRWRNAGGVGGGGGAGKADEVVMFSPHCLGQRTESRQPAMF